MRFLFISGGSGGHLAPLLAVGEKVQALKPEAEILYACADQESDRAFLDAHGVKHVSLKWPRRSLSSITAYARNMQQARAVFAEFKPDVVFSKGGSVSLPSCMLARAARIPVILHESDVVWGKANKLAMKFATKICLGFPPTDHSTLSTNRFIFTGNPVRKDVTEGNRNAGLQISGHSGQKPILLVIGGSQGAQAINDSVIKSLDEILKTCDVIHLTGKGKDHAIKKPGYYSVEFAVETLPDLYAASTIALSRSGAGSIAELAANGIPTILVPLRGVAQDHQLANAKTAHEIGGCTVLDQKTLATTLLPAIKNLLDPEKGQEMQQKMKKLYQPAAAEKIAEIVISAHRR